MQDDEVMTTNRCNFFLRSRGCKHGNACAYCHVHPVTREENLSRASKAYSKKDRVRKREGQDLEEREKKKALADRTALIHKDSSGVFRCGKLIQNIRDVGLVSVSVMSVGRNRERAMRTAAAAAQQLHVSEDDIFMLLNYDFQNPAHFVGGITEGRIAFYESIAKKVLPLLRHHHVLGRAQLHFLLEDDAAINMTGTLEQEEEVNCSGIGGRR